MCRTWMVVVLCSLRLHVTSSTFSSDGDETVALVGEVVFLCEQSIIGNESTNPNITAFEYAEFIVASTGEQFALSLSQLHDIASFDTVELGGTVSVVTEDDDKDSKDMEGIPPRYRRKGSRKFRVQSATKLSPPSDAEDPSSESMGMGKGGRKGKGASHTHTRARRDFTLDTGARGVLVICLTMSNNGVPITADYCTPSTITGVFATNDPMQTINGYFQATTFGHISYPSSNLQVVDLEALDLDISGGCSTPDLRLISQTVDLRVTELQISVLQTNRRCRNTSTVSGVGHDYSTPERCAIRCMCNIDHDQPSGTRLFSHYFDASRSLYSCQCGTDTTGSTACPGGYIQSEFDTTYSFTVPTSGAIVSETEFCAAGNHRVYGMPEEFTNCPFAAAAFVCGEDERGPCQVYTKSASGYVLSHELGHNLGLFHAAVDPNNDGSTTSSDEYGDQSDVMGLGYFAFANMLNAPHMDELGLIPSIRQASLPSSPCEHAITLTTLDVDPTTSTGIHFVTFPRASSIGGGTYYISARRAVGFDTFMSSAVSNRVHVHYKPSFVWSTTRLVEVLSRGDHFVDLASGVDVTVLDVVCGNESVKQPAVDITVNMCATSATLVPPTPFSAFERVSSNGQVCNANDIPILGATFDIEECAALCYKQCGCLGFSFNPSAAIAQRCRGARPAVPTQCCRGSLSLVVDQGWTYYRLTTPADGWCLSMFTVSGSVGGALDGNYMRQQGSNASSTISPCHHTWETADGRTLVWEEDVEVWCFRAAGASSDAGCMATSTDAVDDPSRIQNINEHPGAFLDCGDALFAQQRCSVSAQAATGCRRGARPL